MALGSSRIDARGRIAANIEIDADLAPLQLNDLLPDGRGSVRGTLKLRGARGAPDIDADLRGEGVAFGDYRAQTFVAKGRLPWRNGNGALAIDAQGLQLGLPLTALRANLRGAVERLQFDAEADSELGALAMRPRFPRARRVGFYVAALATYLAIFGIARMHQPLGWLALL